MTLAAPQSSPRGAVSARRYREARRRAQRPRLTRAPRRGVIPTGLVAAAWAAGLGLLVCGALGVLGWALGGTAAASFDGALRVGGVVFAASHLAPVALPHAAVSLLPLGLLALPAWLTYRSGRWAAHATQCTAVSRLAALVAVASVAYASVVAVVAAGSATAGAHVAPGWGFGYGLAVGCCGFGVGAARESRSWRALVLRVPARLRAGAAAATVATAALAAASGLALTVALAFQLPDVAAVGGEVADGVTGGTALVLLGVLYLPNVLVWTLAYLAGPGIAVGSVVVAPTAAAGGGLLPAFPLLAALPQTPPPGAPLLLLLPVAAGVLAGVVLQRRRRRGRVLLGDVLITAAFTALAAAALATLASGSLGDGRLAVVGPDPLLVGLAVGALVLAGATLSALVGTVLGPYGRRLGRPLRTRWRGLRRRLYHDGA